MMDKPDDYTTDTDLCPDIPAGECRGNCTFLDVIYDADITAGQFLEVVGEDYTILKVKPATTAVHLAAIETGTKDYSCRALLQGIFKPSVPFSTKFAVWEPLQFAGGKLIPATAQYMARSFHPGAENKCGLIYFCP